MHGLNINISNFPLPPVIPRRKLNPIMNRFFAFLITALLSLNLCAQEPNPASKNLRAVFWNLEWFPGSRPQATVAEAMDQIVKVVPAVAALKADIFGTTEVHGPNAIAISLYQSPGMSTQVCSEFLDDAGKPTFQQIGIASRLPAMSAWWENWKQGSITPKRGFAFSAFEPSPGNILLVYAVHLKSNRGELAENIAMREESVRQLLDHVKEMEKAYAPLGKVAVIVGGDFNTTLDDPKFDQEKTLRMLQKSGFSWCWEGIPFKDRVTLPSAPPRNPKLPPFPDVCFDHIFTKGVKVTSASVVPIEGEPSDHRPIVVDLEFSTPSTTP